MSRQVYFYYNADIFANAVTRFVEKVILRMVAENYSEQFNKYISSPKFIYRVSKTISARNMGVGEMMYWVADNTTVKDLSDIEKEVVIGETFSSLMEQKIDKKDFVQGGYLKMSKEISLELTLVEYVTQLLLLFFADEDNFADRLKVFYLSKMRQELKGAE